MNILVFDTETTGLPKNWSAPVSDVDNWPRLVQLSWVMTNGKKREEGNHIIKPDGYKISDEVAKIHGITHQRAIDEGKDRKVVLNIFRCFINSADIIVAHNIGFDMAIIGAEYYRLLNSEMFDKLFAEKKLFCTMKQSAEILGLAGSHAGGNKYPKLQELYKAFFDENFDGAHDSMNDTRACEKCFFEIMKLKDINK